jgi:hypothetical protein
VNDVDGTQAQSGREVVDAVAEAYNAWRSARGLSVASDAPKPSPREEARWLLERIEDEQEKCRRRIAGAEASGLPLSHIRRKVEALEREIDRLEDFALKLFGLVHVPAVRGEEYRASEAQCRAEGCDSWFGRDEIFDRAGFCPACWSVATGQEAPSESQDDLERLVLEVVNRSG